MKGQRVGARRKVQQGIGGVGVQGIKISLGKHNASRSAQAGRHAVVVGDVGNSVKIQPRGRRQAEGEEVAFARSGNGSGCQRVQDQSIGGVTDRQQVERIRSGRGVIIDMPLDRQQIRS